MAPTMKYWDDWADAKDMEAMWNDTDVCAEWVAAGEKQGVKVHMSRNSSGKPYVTLTEMMAMSNIIIKRHFGNKLDPLMICAIAEVESNRQPLAYRFEPKLGEASTGLMQTLQSTAEWLARDMGYTYYTNELSPSMLYRPFVSVYFGGSFLKWLSTYKKKIQNEEFMVRAYNGGPNNVTSQSTLVYWNKYLKAKQSLLDQSKGLLNCFRKVEEPNLDSNSPPTTQQASNSLTSSGMKWVYWDEKTSPEDMATLWRHEGVKREWLKSGEQIGKVRFARDSELRPHLTRTELKAIAEAVLSQHFQGGILNEEMLCAVAEICSRRLLYNVESTNGLLNLSLSTALWLHNSLGYKAYSIHVVEDLYRPFVSMYFAASYMSWLSTYEGRQRDDRFIVKAYLVGPQNVHAQIAGPYWLRYIEALAQYQQDKRSNHRLCSVQ
ncbi:hypothetical protein GOP47_0023695 [Adiantum capillus-veneris]|uniref:Transglycosylase SLT domain-containing protein n=1 Tax=Adiantum capillus-veneris TaxID=13818 RepID=A0A9D4U4G4_ADICA|nr:hypothetical protein GOP47_0023695 [Adiantum capillus-veneris]